VQLVKATPETRQIDFIIADNAEDDDVVSELAATRTKIKKEISEKERILKHIGAKPKRRK